MKKLKNMSIKYTFVAFLIAIGTVNVLKAQEAAPANKEDHKCRWEAGARFLPTFTQFDVRNAEGGVVKGEFVMGYGVGGYIGCNFNKNVGVMGEVLYNSLSQKYEDKGLARKININYVNIPLLLSLNTDRYAPINFNVVAGPQIGINAGADVSGNTSNNGEVDTVKAVLAVKQGDLGVAYGAGIDFGGRDVRFGLGFRGVYGLLDVSDKSKSKTTGDYYILDRAHVKTYAGYVGVSVMF